ncbi:hypothetical protein PCIT_a1078 [Pseudoalteromonas citrea]|uniref:Uncharacterized protein n=1 Tax=Pseudoalteromonas citrea TaxID=43655 RepID=A0AAD4FTM2_9GAMM|nr:hypothetical protein PCIT_a1078 [Pseudoalteromonas citrea]
MFFFEDRERSTILFIRKDLPKEVGPEKLKQLEPTILEKISD